MTHMLAKQTCELVLLFTSTSLRKHAMKVLLVLAALIIFSASSPVSNKEWDDWKILHFKEYVDQEDEYRRYQTWMYNKQYIEDHNLLDKDSGFTLAMNEFGDMVRTCIWLPI